MTAHSHPQSLNEPAFDLALMGERIDHDRDIVKRIDLADLDLTGFGINLDVAHNGLKNMFARSLSAVVVSVTPARLPRRQCREAA